MGILPWFHNKRGSYLFPWVQHGLVHGFRKTKKALFVQRVFTTRRTNFLGRNHFGLLVWNPLGVLKGGFSQIRVPKKKTQRFTHKVFSGLKKPRKFNGVFKVGVPHFLHSGLKFPPFKNKGGNFWGSFSNPFSGKRVSFTTQKGKAPGLNFPFPFKKPTPEGFSDTLFRCFPGSINKTVSRENFPLGVLQTSWEHPTTGGIFGANKGSTFLPIEVEVPKHGFGRHFFLTRPPRGFPRGFPYYTIWGVFTPTGLLEEPPGSSSTKVFPFLWDARTN